MVLNVRPYAFRLVVVAVAGSACASTAPVAKAPPPELAAAPAPKPAPPPAAAPKPAAASPKEARAPLEEPPAQAASKEAPLKPAGRGASAYGAVEGKKDRALVPKDSLRAGILKDVSALAKREKRPPPRADARLDAAMNDLAHNLRGDDLPALEVVDFLLTHYGIAEPSPHLLLSRATAGADREIRQQALKEIAAVYKTDPVARVGIGIDRTGGLMYVVVGLQETHLALAPVPRRLARGGETAISGKLIGRFKQARVVVTTPDGKVAEQEPSTKEGWVRGRVACAADGRYQVEVTADDASGTAVLANFPVFCGVEPPAVAPRGAGTRQAHVSAEAAEQDVLALVNRDRAAAGLGAVTWDAKLAEVARAHSRDMADHDFVGHVSPRTGTALDRVHKGGLTPELILENVGRAYSAQEVEAGFMASPGHRANVVEPRATKLGVGVVLGAPVTGTIPLYVTQILTN
jgi:uncharacterized protein YkwD